MHVLFVRSSAQRLSLKPKTCNWDISSACCAGMAERRAYIEQQARVIEVHGIDLLAQVEALLRTVAEYQPQSVAFREGHLNTRRTEQRRSSELLHNELHNRLDHRRIAEIVRKIDTVRWPRG
jgi:hypothetical protein